VSTTNLKVDQFEQLNDKEKIESLHREKNDIQRELEAIRDFIDKAPPRRRELYTRWAEILEKLIELKDVKLKRNEICGSIAKQLKTRGSKDDEIVYMYNCLPELYKTTHELKQLESAELHALANNNKNVAEESKSIEKEFFRAVDFIRNTNPQHFTRAGLQERFMQLDELAFKANQDCTSRAIPVVETTSADQSDLFDIPDRFAEKYSINKPRPKEGYYYEALGIFKEVVDAVQKKARIYGGEDQKQDPTIIPLTEEEDKTFAKAVYALCYVFAPYHDDKWRRDWFQWHKILKDRIDYSLHGAMSRSKIPTSVKKCFRGVTREQIDAKMYIGFKVFKQLVEDIPGLYAIHEFYSTHQQPYLGDLTFRMKDKMSHLS
jgi:hypothetical protein